MSNLHNKTYPNESKAYRTARNKLLVAEKDLRKQISDVTKLRSKLGLGGVLKEDYVFEELKNGKTKKTKFSELFKGNKDTLIIYNMMYDPNWDEGCPACTSILDGLNGSAPHINDKVNFVVIGKAQIKKLNQWAKKRNWNNLQLLSSNANTFNIDYFAQDKAGEQQPLVNVFQKTPQGIFHFYSTEQVFIKSEKGQDHRGVDSIWPIWSMFDLTIDGREDWFPSNSYPRKK